MDLASPLKKKKQFVGYWATNCFYAPAPFDHIRVYLFKLFLIFFLNLTKSHLNKLIQKILIRV